MSRLAFTRPFLHPPTSRTAQSSPVTGSVVNLFSVTSLLISHSFQRNLRKSWETPKGLQNHGMVAEDGTLKVGNCAVHFL